MEYGAEFWWYRLTDPDRAYDGQRQRDRRLGGFHSGCLYCRSAQWRDVERALAVGDGNLGSRRPYS